MGRAALVFQRACSRTGRPSPPLVGRRSAARGSHWRLMHPLRRGRAPVLRSRTAQAPRPLAVTTTSSSVRLRCSTVRGPGRGAITGPPLNPAETSCNVLPETPPERGVFGLLQHVATYRGGLLIPRSQVRSLSGPPQEVHAKPRFVRGFALLPVPISGPPRSEPASTQRFRGSRVVRLPRLPLSSQTTGL
jgi:hypothetical protein